MRLLRVGLRLSLVANQRAPALLHSAIRVGCQQHLQISARSFASSQYLLVRAAPPALQAERKDEVASASGKSTGDAGDKVAEKADGETKAKLTLWQKVKKEARHYWEGTKLLGYEVKVSTKLALKLASGRELSRREDRQLKRTLQDIVRLVPFSMFVVVPFAELLLPIALKLFPNLLPSTYETTTSKTAKSKKLGATRAHVGQYLRDSMQPTQMAVPEFSTKEQQKEFEEFFKQIRDGEKPTRTRLLTVARMFKDDMLLDNLTRSQLAAMAKYINIQGFGTSIILRYQIRHKMRLIKQDDRVIDYEGVDSLNAIELQNACQSRGFKTIGVSTGRLRDDLSNWLQLRLHDRVPSTLLILSSAFSYGQHDLESVYDGILSVLSSLPPEVYHETELELQSHDASNAKRLEVLKEQDDLIREENKEEQESGHVVQVRDNLNVDDDESPKPTTQAEAEVKADQIWYDKAEMSRHPDLNAKPSTPSEADVKADEATYKLADEVAETKEEHPTVSQEDVDADKYFYEKADNAKVDNALNKQKQPPSPEPTASEEDVKADQQFYNLAEEAALRNKEEPTVSQQDAEADESFYKQAEKADKGSAGNTLKQRKQPPAPEPTASEEDVKADQEFYGLAEEAALRNKEEPTVSQQDAEADESFYKQSGEAAHRASTESEAASKADNEWAKKSS